MRLARSFLTRGQYRTDRNDGVRQHPLPLIPEGNRKVNATCEFDPLTNQNVFEKCRECFLAKVTRTMMMTVMMTSKENCQLKIIFMMTMTTIWYDMICY